jgi:tetratricopeptide (TPR) repeat protein
MRGGSKRGYVGLIWVVALACSAAGSSRAHADEPGPAASGAPAAQDEAADGFARKVFAAGKAAFDIGNYDEALQYFQQAYELSGRPQLLYNIGQAADRLRYDETALKAFAKYLQSVPDAPNRLEVEQRLVVLQEIIADKRDAEATASPAPLPTPAQVAAAAQAAPVSAAAAPADATAYADESKPVWKRWWFWAGVGAVVTAVIVTAVVASGGGETTTGDSFVGSDGSVMVTLQRSGH